MFGSFFDLSPEQRSIAELPLESKIFLHGPSGTGKSTAAVERLLGLMAAGTPGNSILVIVPQRTLGETYLKALAYPGVTAGGMASVLTVGGLAQRMVDLFWPIAARLAGFSHPDQPPVFLTLETAQYYMRRLAEPLLDQGYFNSVVIEANRLYSQVLDNLNKAALVGFEVGEIGARLKGAWTGEPGQLRIYDDVQETATRFRNFCLEHNLLDFSLQLEVFHRLLWPMELCRGYLGETYRHLIADNLEEDTPVTHDILAEWLPQMDSALLVFDEGAGYRRFLGADPVSATRLGEFCSGHVRFVNSFVNSEEITLLDNGLKQSFRTAGVKSTGVADPLLENPFEDTQSAAEYRDGNLIDRGQLRHAVKTALSFEPQRYYPQMLEWVAQTIEQLVVDELVPPGEIAVLAPFLPDMLRFSLSQRLESRGIPVRAHRPSRALRDEPAARCLLTLACLAYPEWELAPPRADVAYALVQAIQDMDLVRAQLLAQIVYRVKDNRPVFTSFERIQASMQERITYHLGERFEELRAWLDARREPPDEFDYFLSRMFGEVLSQPGFGFADNLAAGEVTANLVESVQKFRWAAGDVLEDQGVPLGKEYLEMVQAGVIAAQYLRSWSETQEGAVFLAPATTFLLGNRPVSVQFWLDVGSHGWSERLNQPLTQPYVLSRQWRTGRRWTDAEEVLIGTQIMAKMVHGLLRRCRTRIFLGMSQLGETGYEGRGPLLQAFQRLLILSEG